MKGEAEAEREEGFSAPAPASASATAAAEEEEEELEEEELEEEELEEEELEEEELEEEAAAALAHKAASPARAIRAAVRLRSRAAREARLPKTLPLWWRLSFERYASPPAPSLP